MRNAAAAALAIAAAVLFAWMSLRTDGGVTRTNALARPGTPPSPPARITMDLTERRHMPIALAIEEVESRPAARASDRRFEFESRLGGGLEAAADDSSAEDAPPAAASPPRVAPQPAPMLAESPPRPKPEGAADDEGSDAEH